MVWTAFMHVLRECPWPAIRPRAVAGAFFAIAALVTAPIPSARAAETPPAMPVAATPYYVATAGEARGPFSLEVVLGEIRGGRVSSWTLVWKPGLSGWIRAGDLPELGDALADAVPKPPPPPPQPPTPPPPDPPAEVAYFVADAGTVRGPLSPTEIGEEIAAGRITAATLVWQPGGEAWQAAGEVPALRDIFERQPPVVPAADSMRQLMIGTWEFVTEFGDDMGARTTLEYRPDMTFSGFVTVQVAGSDPSTHAVAGVWSIAAATADRFALTLAPADGPPGTVQLRVVDRDTLVNETDGGSARRVVVE